MSLIDVKPLMAIGEYPSNDIPVPDELVTSSKKLVVRAIGGTDLDTLADLRTQKFLAGKSALLLNLPPTADALEQHIKCATLSTIISKSSHIPQPQPIEVESYAMNGFSKAPMCSNLSC